MQTQFVGHKKQKQGEVYTLSLVKNMNYITYIHVTFTIMICVLLVT